MNINQKTQQLTLDFEGGLTQRFSCLRDAIATGVYRRGLSATAIDLNKAPGNLSVEISDDPSRKFSVDDFERYIEKSGDVTPLYYLCEKFLADRTAKREAAVSQLTDLLAQIQPLMNQVRGT